ncbi:hypothetical protein EV383_4307 [Pseudonocardia sediminis]|uniref:Uncharacterized protein n=1 Tax=Pseudonocardia sediminis TaxID=1397368 RepID=A0A4Q7UZ19_PSEST|nr:DUF5994 family protein [Pseudonocardia sediminis]RZT87387.1 hypothetical protein EV383_4307 [Pseudonocardia sediminis]
MTSSLAEASAPSTAGRRLTFKPDSSTDTGYVDGAWWPRSRDLAVELEALAAEPGAGHVDRVSYSFPDWDDTPRRALVDGTVVKLGGYRTLPAHTMNVLDGSRWRTLLVVPPGTSAADAEHALAAAGSAGNLDSVADLLAPRSP